MDVAYENLEVSICIFFMVYSYCYNKKVTMSFENIKRVTFINQIDTLNSTKMKKFLSI